MEWDQDRINKGINVMAGLLRKSHGEMREARKARPLPRNSPQAKCKKCGFVDSKQNMIKKAYARTVSYLCAECCKKK